MMPVQRFVVVAGLALAAGCQQGVGHDAAPAASTTVAARVASPPPSPTSPPQRFTRFRVTSAKPSDVEAAMSQGWRLVNCSVARGGTQTGGPMGVYTIDHCYLEGDEHVVDVDGGAPAGL